MSAVVRPASLLVDVNGDLRAALDRLLGAERRLQAVGRRGPFSVAARAASWHVDVAVSRLLEALDHIWPHVRHEGGSDPGGAVPGPTASNLLVDLDTD